ncbi:MAG: 2-succinyl-5-enolpyruvyl-6-hydroxy-3-cyclohexene-1-carboxylic-acid synthase, partial [bacterium]
RSAAFFALGRGRATGRPTAVVTTSGTAVANLFPAVVEASQAEVPLVLLTADRPPHLRGADANQAMDQVRLFGAYVREFFDVELPRVEGRSLRHLRTQAARAVAGALGAPPGPVHLNVPFEKPLEPTPVPGDVPGDFVDVHPRAAEGRATGDPYVGITLRRSAVNPADVDRVTVLLRSADRALIVAGPSSEANEVGSALRGLAAAARVPLLADPLSGARYRRGPAAPLVSRYDLALRDPRVRKALRPDVLIRVGAAPTSGTLRTFLEECSDARQVVVDDGHRYKDHLASAHEYIRSDPASFLNEVAETVSKRHGGSGGGTESGGGGGSVRGATSHGGELSVRDGWLDLWTRVESRVADVVAEEMEGELFEGAVVRGVMDAIPEGESLFVSNSMPVRDLDTFVSDAGGTVWVHGNRGASGIDGVVSTALGLSHGLRRPVTAILGDLAFCHDMNGLAAARRGRGDVTFVVVNNDGGGIFHLLPIREFDPPFTDLFATPHGLDFRHAAALYDVPYTRAATLDELEIALAKGWRDGGSRIVEIRTDREVNRRRHEEVADAVRRALIEVLDGSAI